MGDVKAGLRRRPKSLPSRYFYDARGSRIFQWITNLPEYYLSRAEQEILDRHGEEIVAALVGKRCTVVDLGAGDGHKTRVLLEQLRGRSPAVAYAPVDLSWGALDEAVSRVRLELPGIEVLPLRTEYGEGLRRLSRVRARDEAKLVLFLGSSIGNFERGEAVDFLRDLRGGLRPGDHALVGFDLLKDPTVLQRAYDDAQGVTAAFNLNLLVRINRELGADFDVASFEHRARFDPRRPAMESWLVSCRRQEVKIAGETFTFEAGEAIHTEISCKYLEEDVTAFAREAGFQEAGRFRDRRHWFLDALWRAGG